MITLAINVVKIVEIIRILKLLALKFLKKEYKNTKNNEKEIIYSLKLKLSNYWYSKISNY